MSLAFPGPSEDLEASTFDESECLLKKHITPWHILANSFPVGKKTPDWEQMLEYNYKYNVIPDHLMYNNYQ